MASENNNSNVQVNSDVHSAIPLFVFAPVLLRYMTISPLKTRIAKNRQDQLIVYKELHFECLATLQVKLHGKWRKWYLSNVTVIKSDLPFHKPFSVPENTRSG